MLNEESAFALLAKYYPNSSVCCNEYDQLAKQLGLQYFDLRLFCREQGFRDVRSWLIAKRKYIPMERDMQSGFDVELMEENDPVIISQKIFRTYPLLGDIMLSEKQNNDIIDYAQRVFDRIYDGFKHSHDDDIVLVLAILLLLRKKQNADEEQDESFWPYIYSQFGHVHGETSPTVYASLRKAVSNALESYGRYIAPPGTQKYYTSLMLHALAPIGSMENLFEILLYFYEKELNYEYVPEDPVYRAIVNCIANRWDKEIQKDPELHVKSYVVASGLKTLFQDRPVFMAKFCEMLVRKIDALVRNQGSSLLKKESYLDYLLESWFVKLSEERREKLNKEKTQSKKTGRVSSAENVKLKYVLYDKQVSILVPPIRLESVENEEPEFQLYQGHNLIASGTLEVYGRYCWTIRQRYINLCDYPADFSRLDEFRMVILYGGKVLVDTKKTLSREYIIFDKNGHEIPRQSLGTGKYYVFIPESVEVVFSDEMEPFSMNHPGQLYELWLQENASILVNGYELIQTKKGKESFHHSTKSERVLDVQACNGENQFSIYPEVPVINFRLPENASPLQYRIRVDGVEQPLEEVCKADDDSFDYQLPATDENSHLIQMIDWQNSRVVYEYRFVVLGHFNCILEKDVFFDDGTPIRAIVQYNDSLYEVEALPEEDEDVIFVNVGGLDYDIKIKVPLVRCFMGETNLLHETRTIWHENIQKDDFIQVTVPSGWDYFLNYEGKWMKPLAGKDEYYEFGNFVKAQDYKKDIASLFLIVKRSDGKVDHRDLLRVAYQPQFSQDMLQLDENMELVWRPSGRIICGKKDEFKCYIHQITDRPEDDYEYTLTTKNERLYARFDDKRGCFPYEIYLKGKTGFFSTQEDKLLYKGKLKVGSDAEIRLYRKEIFIKAARECVYYNHGEWLVDKIVPLTERSARLTNFKYLGAEIPPCSEDYGTAVPKFEARMYYLDQHGRKNFFNSDEHNLLYETINPVTIWLLTDHLLYMLTVTGDMILLDKRFNSFVNRKLLLGRLEMDERIRTPDLFEYVVTEEGNVI